MSPSRQGRLAVGRRRERFTRLASSTGCLPICIVGSADRTALEVNLFVPHAAGASAGLTRAGLSQSEEPKDEEDDDDGADKVDDTIHEHILCEATVQLQRDRQVDDLRLRVERLCICARKDSFFRVPGALDLDR